MHNLFSSGLPYYQFDTMHTDRVHLRGRESSFSKWKSSCKWAKFWFHTLVVLEGQREREREREREKERERGVVKRGYD
jgi:hypothetical protein